MAAVVRKPAASAAKAAPPPVKAPPKAPIKPPEIAAEATEEGRKAEPEQPPVVPAVKPVPKVPSTVKAAPKAPVRPPELPELPPQPPPQEPVPKVPTLQKPPAPKAPAPVPEQKPPAPTLQKAAGITPVKPGAKAAGITPVQAKAGVQLQPPPAPPVKAKPKGRSKKAAELPAGYGEVKQVGKSLIELLSSIFINASYDDDKAKELYEVIQQENVIDDPEEVRALSRILTQRDVSPDALQRLFRLERFFMTNADPRLRRYVGLIPYHYVVPEFSTDRAEALTEYIASLQSELVLTPVEVDQLTNAVAEKPVTQEDVVLMREALEKLTVKVNNARATGRIDDETAKDILESFPIALLDRAKIDHLLSLTYSDYPKEGPKAFILDPNNREVVAAVIALIMSYGYYMALDVLEHAARPTDLTFNSPVMQNARKKNRVNREIIRTRIEVMQTGVESSFKCPNCGSRNIIYVSKQLRSGDEPMTIEATCLNCRRLFHPPS